MKSVILNILNVVLRLWYLSSGSSEYSEAEQGEGCRGRARLYGEAEAKAKIVVLRLLERLGKAVVATAKALKTMRRLLY
jgi:hypothetical protein